MNPSVTTCLRCGLSGYDIAPRAGRGRRAYCRYCLADPSFVADPVAAHRWTKRLHMRRKRAQAYASRRLALDTAAARAVLGPCRCMGCGKRKYWTGFEWQSARGEVHNCGKLAGPSTGGHQRGGPGAHSPGPAGAL